MTRPFGSDRTFKQALMSLAGAALLALLVPVAILVIGTPVSLIVRGLLELVQWLLSSVR